ncbi:MAG: glucose-6-phosphate isomerase [Candidatus Moranbacteria bacterium]|nr:glucose-6-phosphate isomerase [Candidatus Moranbacteria bacterium]
MSRSIYMDTGLSGIALEEIKRLETAAVQAAERLYGGREEFTGWVDLPESYDAGEVKRIEETAEKIQAKCSAFVVIGIGGSYLGARAAYELLSGSFPLLRQKEYPRLFFAGNNLSAAYHSELLDVLKDEDVCLCVISKSGTTAEPAIAFALLKDFLVQKYGKEEAAKRIYAITDASKGVLREEAKAEGYESFIVPDDIGGRYSVLTAVGLLPLAVAGIDVDQLLAGARQAQTDLAVPNLDNPAWQYAGGRQLLARSGKAIEVLSSYEPSLQLLNEWWKQLFGESEGKNQQGIFPASVQFTTDLHSLGQFMQEGSRNLFETMLWLDEDKFKVSVPHDEENFDQLNFLENKNLHFINEQAFKATLSAHESGGVPNFLIRLPEMNAWQIAYLLYFFEFSCALSAYLSGVNPFNQPGVEVYKKKMFELLGKN